MARDWMDERPLEEIKVLRDFPIDRLWGPVLRAGEVVSGYRVEPAEGCRGFAGWHVTVGSSATSWALEDGVDAERTPSSVAAFEAAARLAVIEGRKEGEGDAAD